MCQVLCLEQEEENLQEKFIHLLDTIGHTYVPIGEIQKGLGYKEKAVGLYLDLYREQPNLQLASMNYDSLRKFHQALVYAQQAVEMKRLFYDGEGTILFWSTHSITPMLHCSWRP